MHVHWDEKKQQAGEEDEKKHRPRESWNFKLIQN